MSIDTSQYRIWESRLRVSSTSGRSRSSFRASACGEVGEMLVDRRLVMGDEAVVVCAVRENHSSINSEGKQHGELLSKSSSSSSSTALGGKKLNG